MKKIALLLMMFIVVINISAQESKESQKINSLQYKLDKLQHDYNFLDCDYKLNKLTLDLKIYTSDLKATVNSLLINLYHDGYNENSYQLNMKNYESCKNLLEKQERLIYSTISNIKQEMDSANFYEIEINYLNSCFETIDAGLYSAKTVLEYYKTILDVFRDTK